MIYREYLCPELNVLLSDPKYKTGDAGGESEEEEEEPSTLPPCMPFGPLRATGSFPTMNSLASQYTLPVNANLPKYALDEPDRYLDLYFR